MKTLLTIVLILLGGYLYSQNDSLRVQEIQAVSVSAIPKKEIAYKDRRHYIMDFHIDSNGIFLLLKRFKQYYVYELNSRMKPVEKKLLTFHPKSMFCDCTGQLYVLSKEHMYPLQKKEKSIVFGRRRPIELLEYTLKNCVASTSEAKIYKHVRNFNQTTEFYQTGTYDGITRDIYVIEDSSLLRSVREAREEIDRENERLRRKYNRDQVYQQAPTWEDQTSTGQLRRDQVHEIRNHMLRRQLFGKFVARPTYNPLFVKRDTFYVFDHVNGYRVRIDKDTSVIDKMPLSHHTTKKWKGEMHLDNARGRFYSVEERNGAQIFGLLSRDSKRVIRRTKITRHAYPRKVIVYQGYAYYTYREYFDDNLNKLFRQKL